MTASVVAVDVTRSKPASAFTRSAPAWEIVSGAARPVTAVSETSIVSSNWDALTTMLSASAVIAWTVVPVRSSMVSVSAAMSTCSTRLASAPPIRARVPSGDRCSASAG